MVSSPKCFTCAELVPCLFPYFSFLFGAQQLSSQRSRARAQRLSDSSENVWHLA